MMKKILTTSNLALLLLLLVIPVTTFAKKLPKQNFLVTGQDLLVNPISATTPYVKNVSIPLVLPAPSGPVSRISTYQNTIELKYRNHSALDVDANVKIEAELTFYTVANSNDPITRNITLTIDYKVAAQQKNIIEDVFAFTNAYKVDLKITSLVITHTVPQLPQKLENFIEVNIGFQEERITRINFPDITSSITACKDDITDELVIRWAGMTNAEEYELEYTFVDDYTDSYASLSANQIAYNFKDNSTRISTKETYYRLPLLYERGYIIYRVRAIGRSGQNLDVPIRCDWSGATSGQVGAISNSFYHTTAHGGDSLNWQVAATFAEDGKRSDAIKYMDGTFRSRQTVTGVNLEHRFPTGGILILGNGTDQCTEGNYKQREVIAGETIYDHQGRPAVNMLPVPTDSKKLEFLPLLNISDNVISPNTVKRPYNWQDFDRSNYTCPSTNKLFPQPHATTGIMGAAAYYSPNNPNLLGFNAFIPDSKQYPFTQISYVQDNTGRIAAQSGVGPVFQFGAGHETRFYYASPNQQELDRMFGTEVGDALRYKKNAVMDPNGQISVTYINPEGKTIATSLAGKTPDSLEALKDKVTETIDVPLMSKNVVDSTDKTLILEHNFLVTSDNTDHTFVYSIIPEQLATTLCSGTNICLDCIYDFEIKLNHVESCTGTPIFTKSGTIGELIDPLNGDTSLVCENTVNTGDYMRDTTMTLNIGTYVLTKKVSINKNAATAYIARVFRDTCRGKWDELLADEMTRVDTMDCYKSCSTCPQPPVQSNTPPCDTAYCKPSPNRCQVIRDMMLADVSPGGQYGQFDRSGNGTNADAYLLSVFNQANILPTQAIDFAEFAPLFSTGSAQDRIDSLINNWRPEYAEFLLSMHPEHCMLGWCTDPVRGIDTTLDFDMQILSTEYHHDAVVKGYLVPSSTLRPYEQLLNADPWFFGGAHQVEKQNLLNKLTSYGCGTSLSPIDDLAEQAAYCANYMSPQWQQGTPPQMNNGPSCTLPANYAATRVFGDPAPFGNPPPNNGALEDLEWTLLRAMYISAKNESLNADMLLYARDSSCNYRCIGNDDYYNGWNYFTASPWSMKPCNFTEWWAWVFYSDKQSRFSTGIENILSVMENAGISIDASTINNYDDPCEFMSAIQSQSMSINHQVTTTLCGDDSLVTSPCPPGVDLVGVVTSSFDLLDGQVIQLSGANIPPTLRNSGVTGITISKPDSISFRIVINPFKDIITIPYKKTSAGHIKPISVCCISNIKRLENTRSSFDMTVNYADGSSNTMLNTRTTATITDCVDSTHGICKQPTPQLTTFKSYLNSIFQYTKANSSFPTSIQLSSWLPPLLKNVPNRTYSSVSLNTTSNYVISMDYLDPSGARNSCSITLDYNFLIANWTNVLTVLSIKPDISVAVGGVTNGFKIKAIVGTTASNMHVVEINGRSTCWPTNQCPPPNTLCDSVPILPDYPYNNECVERLLATAHANTSIRYTAWVDSLKGDLLAKYYAKCLGSIETCSIQYVDSQYHYTLYYYDQAGNLVKTIPPAGVRMLSAALLPNVTASRLNQYNVPVLPPHLKQTVYRYNTLNQSVWQQTPDAGESNFMYDGLGRIVASQNAQQRQDGNFYSYAKYDKLGRLVEAGKLQSTAITPWLVRNFVGWQNFIDNLSTRSEITLTKYDEFYNSAINAKFGTSGQRNLRKRVASIFNFPTRAAMPNGYTHATHYTYDIEGNVYKLIQDYPNGIIGDKTIEYDYDLQSGKVNSVSYQKGKPDQFLHSYSYDAANRLTKARTSTDGLHWDVDAEYFYYRHGPLARLELGTDKVQGLDYMYTLQGWIKGVNGVSITTETDMGRDGGANPVAQPPPPVVIGGMSYQVFDLAMLFGPAYNGPGYGAMHNPVARDAFGYILDYFGQDDYQPIIANTVLDAFTGQQSGSVWHLYNGNICRMYSQIQTINNNGFNYKYDQLNRLVGQQAWKLDETQPTLPMALLPSAAYAGRITYDPDGNIMNLVRHGKPAIPEMDRLQYNYYKQDGGIYNAVTYTPSLLTTNKLACVIDTANPANYPNDIDMQNLFTPNYKYDLIGNLIFDESEHITQIKWNLQNKIASITKSVGASMSFEYDALGNRVMKDVDGPSSAEKVRTFYVRDAQGNTMATYSYKFPMDPVTHNYGTTKKLFWSEAHIYGSSRVGLFLPDTIIPEVPVSGSPTGNIYQLRAGLINVPLSLYGGIIYQAEEFTARPRNGSGTNMNEAYYTSTRGYKQYELANHLGNVLATITDRKLPTVTSGTVSYTADQSTGQDYYGFGMLMPGREYSASNLYRYGFNGKENDNEVKGAGNQQDYGFRIYDPRIGKFLSVDPLTKKYPWYTPYQFAGNKSIQFVDLDGNEEDSKTKPTTIPNNTKGDNIPLPLVPKPKKIVEKAKKTPDPPIIKPQAFEPKEINETKDNAKGPNFINPEDYDKQMKLAAELQAAEEKKIEAKRELESRHGYKEWKAKQDEAYAKKTLTDMFGKTGGTILWHTRGGGQQGEDAPVWSILEGLSGFSKGAAPRPDKTWYIPITGNSP